MSGAVKLIAAVLVVLGGGYLGNIMSSVHSVRVKQIGQFKGVINQIGFNIGFLNMTVADAMEEASKISNGAVKNIFCHASSLVRGKGVSPYVALERGFLKFRDDLCLTDEDRGIVMDFAGNLGAGDRISEENNIKAAVAKLTLSEEEAGACFERKGKLWRGLGYLGGTVLVVILF